jgi:hypothetical protein
VFNLLALIIVGLAISFSCFAQTRSASEESNLNYPKTDSVPSQNGASVLTGIRPSSEQVKPRDYAAPELIAFVRVGDEGIVVLRNSADASIMLLKEGDRAWGYLLKQIHVQEETIQLERDGQFLTLKLMREQEETVPLNRQEKFSDSKSSDNEAEHPLIVSAQRWVDDWSKYRDSLPPEQQPSSDQIREYWRRQWISGLYDFATKHLTPDEQTRLRQEISRSWRK